MKKQFLEYQLPLLVSIQATDRIHQSTFLPHPKGFACEIQGSPTKELLTAIFNFLEAYAVKETYPLPLLDWGNITPFTQKVLLFLETIPFGQIMTYGQVARELGSPESARAIGGACGRNPFPFFLPCHRVLSRQGLGGFSIGLNFKKNLLKYEGFSINNFK